MAKGTFASSTFKSKTFASGTWTGVGAAVQAPSAVFLFVVQYVYVKLMQLMRRGWC